MDNRPFCNKSFKFLLLSDIDSRYRCFSLPDRSLSYLPKNPQPSLHLLLFQHLAYYVSDGMLFAIILCSKPSSIYVFVLAGDGFMENEM